MTELGRVWEPIDVGNVRLRNRIMVTPHGVGWGGNNLPHDRQIAYYTERARGGAGLVCVGSTMAMSRGIPENDPPAVASDPRTVPMFADLATTMHAHGAPVFIQLGEIGVHSSSRGRFDRWGPPWGPSRVPSMTRGVEPAIIDRTWIREMITDTVQACQHFVEAGVDGVTLHAAHSYLFMQFLSRAYNHRTDEYGGSLENRARLLIDTLHEVRDAVGDQLAVGVRVSMDEYLGDAGWTPSEADELIDRLAGLGLVTHVDVSSGGYHSPQRFVASMAYETGHLEDHGQRVRRLLDGRAVMFLVGRYRRIDQAEAALERGATDVVGMTRAHIADPDLVAKAHDGRSEEIQHCIGANECILNFHLTGQMSCAVNPRAGRERQWPTPAPSAAEGRRVTVIGAGPAGLRAAVVAAERGHAVTVLERGEEAGGHVRDLALLPGREQYQDLTIDLVRRLRARGVEVTHSTEATPSRLADTDPQDVVVAIGAEWLTAGYTPAMPGRNEIPGIGTGRPMAIDAAIRQAVRNPQALGASVTILDETGDWPTFGLASMLAQAGVQVTVLSRHDYLGWRLRESHQIQHVMPVLVRHGVRLLPQHIPLRIDGERLEVASLFAHDVTLDVGASTLVLAATREARSLAFDPQDAVPGAHIRLIGDALSPRSTADAVHDGEQAGWAIGSPSGARDSASATTLPQRR